MTEKWKLKTCFPAETRAKVNPLLPKVATEIQKLLDIPVKLPETVECMTPEEITGGQETGAGHGLFISPGTVKVNPSMDVDLTLANVIHEVLHQNLPDVSESGTDALTDYVYRKMKQEEAKR